MTVASLSASLAEAVIPTGVPFEAFSATLPPLGPSVLVGPTSGLSFTFVTAMANACELKLPAASVARIVMVWLVAAW